MAALWAPPIPFSFNGSAETDATFNVSAGKANATLAGGAGADSFTLESGGVGGTDTVRGNGGADFFFVDQFGGGISTFVYGGASESTGSTCDVLDDFNWSFVRFHLPGSVNIINAAVTTGSLSTAFFDTNLAGDVGGGQLSPNGAVLFTPNGGDQAGQTFLVVDMNGQAGYQASQDLVIHLEGISGGTLTTGNFI